MEKKCVNFISEQISEITDSAEVIHALVQDTTIRSIVIGEIHNIHRATTAIEAAIKKANHETLKKVFDERIKNSKYNQWLREITISALHKGEQFHRDHGRPMTYDEKLEWAKSKSSLLGGNK